VDGPASRWKFVSGTVFLGASRWPPQIVIRYMASMTADFPEEFSVQTIRTSAVCYVTHLSPRELAVYFHDHPDVAKDLLLESYDKRWTPASFIEEKDGRYRVGWFSSKFQYECIRWFSNLPDAATDYVIFSLGRGRWSAEAAAI
jgi:hypothetical protein